MPVLSTVATVSTTKEITLKPALKRKLMTELRAYAAIKEQLKTLEHAADKHKDVIGKLREETGEQSLAIEGFKVTQVAPIRKKFNAKKFILIGGDISLFNEAHEDVPGKPFEKITLPGSKDRDEED